MIRARVLPGGRSVAIVSDPLDPASVELLVDGVAQSHVSTEHPERLRYDYLERMASVTDLALAGLDAPRLLHLGGAGLSLPRRMARSHPHASQTVVDAELGLVDYVLEALPDPLLRVRSLTEDADAAVVRLADAGERFDAIEHDVYVGTLLPTHLRGEEHVRHLDAVLANGGTLLVNVADDPGIPVARELARTLERVFPHVLASAPTTVLEGRVDGNVVLVASRDATILSWIPALGLTGPHPGSVGPAADLLP